MHLSIRNKIARHLDRRNIHTDGEIHLYLITFVVLAFCLATHVYLLCAFLIGGIPVFIGLNTFSVCLYFLMFFAHRKRHYKAIALITSIDVSLYATITILLNGITSYVVGYYLLVIMLQIILPYTSSRVRSIIIGAVVVVSLPAILFSYSSDPLITLSQPLTTFLTLSNIYILFLGTVVELYIGTIVRWIIEQLNENRMEKLAVLANTDPLTGLFNRRYAESCFTDILEARKSIPYCVAMLDIDDFKRVNDTWGHVCGDEVLVFLADFIVQNLRRSDLVFRWGGEEFLLVLENVDLPTAYTILDKLRNKLQNTAIVTSEQTLHITVTIGAAVLDTDHSAASIKKSDVNLYVGKQKQKNIVVAG